MLEVKGNLWHYHDAGWWVAITTNGYVKRRNGECVMGAGVANQAARKYPKLPYLLGAKIQQNGNRPYAFDDERIISFPVKHNWFEEADLSLIIASANAMSELLLAKNIDYIAIPRPGCGNGRLDWEGLVRPSLVRLMDDRFTVVQI